MVERVRFTVTQEHIDAGVRSDVGSEAHRKCPIALALREARPENDWSVWGARRGDRRGLVTDTDDYENANKWWLSTRACAFVRAFDDRRTVQPFTAEVYR